MHYYRIIWGFKLTKAVGPAKIKVSAKETAILSAICLSFITLSGIIFLGSLLCCWGDPCWGEGWWGLEALFWGWGVAGWGLVTGALFHWELSITVRGCHSELDRIIGLCTYFWGAAWWVWGTSPPWWWWLGPPWWWWWGPSPPWWWWLGSPRWWWCGPPWWGAA